MGHSYNKLHLWWQCQWQSLKIHSLCQDINFSVYCKPASLEILCLPSGFFLLSLLQVKDFSSFLFLIHTIVIKLWNSILWQIEFKIFLHPNEPSQKSKIWHFRFSKSFLLTKSQLNNPENDFLLEYQTRRTTLNNKFLNFFFCVHRFHLLKMNPILVGSQLKLFCKISKNPLRMLTPVFKKMVRMCPSSYLKSKLCPVLCFIKWLGKILKMSLIQPIKSKTWQARHFKLPHFKTSHPISKQGWKVGGR